MMKVVVFVTFVLVGLVTSEEENNDQNVPCGGLELEECVDWKMCKSARRVADDLCGGFGDGKEEMPPRAFCRISYGRKCFWGIFEGDGTTNLQKANFYCSQNGGTLAGIYSAQHYAMILDLLREQLPFDPDNTLGVWTGMKKVQGRKVAFSNGTLAPYMNGKWFIGNPSTGGSTHLAVVVRSSGQDGLANPPITARVFGAICEI